MDRSSRPSRALYRIPGPVREKTKNLALQESDLSPRELSRDAAHAFGRNFQAIHPTQMSLSPCSFPAIGDICKISQACRKRCPRHC